MSFLTTRSGRFESLLLHLDFSVVNAVVVVVVSVNVTVVVNVNVTVVVNVDVDVVVSVVV